MSSRTIGQISVAALRERVEALQRELEKLPPAERPKLASQVRELVSTIAAELHRDREELYESSSNLRQAQEQARSSFQEMVDLAKLQNRQTWGIFGHVARVDEKKLQAEADEAAHLAERAQEVTAIEHEVSGDVELLRAARTLLAEAHPLTHAFDFAKMATTRNALQVYGSDTSAFGATVAAAALTVTNADPAQAKELRDTLLEVRSTPTECASNLAAALALTTPGFDASRDAPRVRQLAASLRRFDGVESAAGATFAAMYALTSPNFDPARDAAKLVATRDGLAQSRVWTHETGATLAAAVLATNPRFDVARDLGAVLELRNELATYGSPLSSVSSYLAAALLFDAPGFDRQQDMGKVRELRDQLKTYGSDGSDGGATLAAALLVRSQGAAAFALAGPAKEAADALRVYGNGESDGGAILASALLFGQGRPPSPEDLVALSHVERSLQKYGSGGAAAGATLAAALSSVPNATRETLLAAALFIAYSSS